MTKGASAEGIILWLRNHYRCCCAFIFAACSTYMVCNDLIFATLLIYHHLGRRPVDKAFFHVWVSRLSTILRFPSLAPPPSSVQLSQRLGLPGHQLYIIPQPDCN